MRILFVNSVRGWGGGVSSALELARGLAAAGDEVTLACNAAGELRRRLRDQDAVRAAPVSSGPDFDPVSARVLARLVREHRADVAIADRRKDVKQLLIARMFGPGVPIVHRHGAPSTLRDALSYRLAWSRIAAMVVNSQAMRRALLDATPWLRDVEIHVVHNGVDSERFQPLPHLRAQTRAAQGIDENERVIAFHGILQPRKRVDLLVRAVSHLAPSDRPSLLIIGDGPERPALERLASELRVRALFTGLRDDVPQLLAAADAAAHLSAAEGFSNSVLEDLACGLPVIATDEHSHPEQIDPHITGLLVPPDAACLAEALRTLLADAPRLAAMARAARDTAVQRFSIASMVREYRDVLARASARA